MSVQAASSTRSDTSRRRAIGLGASAFAAIGWGFGAIFAKLAFASGLVLSFYRLWLGALLFLALLYGTRRRLTWDNLKASWIGGVFMAGDICTFFCAAKLTSIVDVMVIGAVQPALVLVAARPLFGERMGRWDVFWVFVSIAAVSAAVIGPGAAGHDEMVGDLLAVVSLVCWTGYWLVSKHARRTESSLEYTASVTTVAAVVMTPVVLLSGQSLGRVEAGDWLWIALLAVVPGAANLAMNWAHRYVDASVSSVIGASSPVVAAVAALVILGQRLTAVQVCCGAVALAAIGIVAVRHRQPIGSALE